MFNFGKNTNEEEIQPVKTDTQEKKVFQKKEKKQITNQTNPMTTTIGKETEFEGDIKTENKIEIFGYYKGTVTAQDHFTLGDGGKFEGDINCKDLEIAGEVNGNIRARGKVTVKSTAYIQGDLRYYNLEIESGANVACTISRMNPDEKSDRKETNLYNTKKETPPKQPELPKEVNVQSK